MNLALESSQCIVAVTHVRNMLATQTIIEHGDRDRVPVRGGPPTGTLIVVEKRDGIWRMSADNGKPNVTGEPDVAFVPPSPAEARA
jgi:hypothetical protein